MSVTLNAEARARLDKHLDAVEAALVAAGNLREQRRGVLDDLEAQILDMLTARSAAPTVEDVEAVLRQVDPPEAYQGMADVKKGRLGVEAFGDVAKKEGRVSRSAIGAVTCVLGSLVLILGTNYVLWVMVAEREKSRSHAELGFLVAGRVAVVFLFFIGLIGTILGWVAFARIRGAKGSLKGSGLALFSGLFYPAILVLVLLIVVIKALGDRG